MTHPKDRSVALLLVLIVLLAGSAPPRAAAQAPAPGTARRTARAGYAPAELPYQLWPAEAVSPAGVVSSGSEPASRAGVAILEAGGNAVDAAVATAFALGVTEPMTSGLGAEALILVYGADGRFTAIDGSCYVPTLARAGELQLERARSERGYLQGYKSAAVPGSLAALSYAVERYGTKSLAEVMAPAIELADFGYTLTPTSEAEIEGLGRFLWPHPGLSDLLLRDFTGTWPPGHVYCASDLANTLRRIARLGADDFYRGTIADEIDADMARNGGYIRKSDLARLRVVERQPLRDSYRGLDLISFPYPGGGGMLLEMLHILETFPPELLQGDSLDRLHVLIEAGRIASADSQNSRLPLPLLDRQLADRRWAQARARLIRLDRALLQSEISGEAFDPFLTLGTTQVSVVDRWGNVVGLSQTIGGFFGSCEITPGLGFIYNSNMNAFNLTDPLNPHFAAPGRAATTALAPTIILKDGRPVAVLGSAGSERVVPSLGCVISQVADRGLDMCQAVAAPRAIWGTNWADPRAFLELAGEITPERVDALEKRGFRGLYRLKFPARLMDISAFGGTNAVAVDPLTGLLRGVPDPRRSGTAAAVEMR